MWCAKFSKNKWCTCDKFAFVHVILNECVVFLSVFRCRSIFSTFPWKLVGQAETCWFCKLVVFQEICSQYWWIGLTFTLLAPKALPYLPSNLREEYFANTPHKPASCANVKYFSMSNICQIFLSNICRPKEREEYFANTHARILPMSNIFHPNIIHPKFLANFGRKVFCKQHQIFSLQMNENGWRWLKLIKIDVKIWGQELSFDRAYIYPITRDILVILLTIWFSICHLSPPSPPAVVLQIFSRSRRSQQTHPTPPCLSYLFRYFYFPPANTFDQKLSSYWPNSSLKWSW